MARLPPFHLRHHAHLQMLSPLHPCNCLHQQSDSQPALQVRKNISQHNQSESEWHVCLMLFAAGNLISNQRKSNGQRHGQPRMIEAISQNAWPPGGPQWGTPDLGKQGCSLTA